MTQLHQLPLPSKFLVKMQQLLGEEFQSFTACYTLPAEIGLRVNILKCTPEEFAAALKAAPAGFSACTMEPVSWCPTGFRLIPGSGASYTECQPGKHNYHAAGLFYLQDPSAMAVAEILAPKPGERILDLAAAPGGKTTHLAALMQNQGLLVANEIHPRRVWDLAQNIERCGVRNAAIFNETPQRLADHFGPFFDRVLVDAPCSGEGMFRKSVEAIQAWSPELVLSCANRQLAILKSAASMVRPGGYLGYSTCTFSPEENELVVTRFLDEQAQESYTFEIIKTMRLWPHHGAAEGHFIALLQRTNGHNAHKLISWQGKISSSALNTFQEFARNYLRMDSQPGRLVLQGTYLYALPEGIPDWHGLRIIHPGWWLGSIRKNRFEPAHALAMGLQIKQANQVELLDAEDPKIQAYFHGESLSIPGQEGWTLLAIYLPHTHMAFPIGWGKRSRGMVKNAFPRGLRRLS